MTDSTPSKAFPLRMSETKARSMAAEATWTRAGNDNTEENSTTWHATCSDMQAIYSLLENSFDGETQCTAQISVATSTCSMHEIVTRARNAWLLCHGATPQIAVELSEGRDTQHTMRFRQLTTEQELAMWMNDTFHHISVSGLALATTASNLAEQIRRRAIPTRGKTAMLYIITPSISLPLFEQQSVSPSENSFHVVFNASHTFADGYGIMSVLQRLCESMVQVPGDILLSVDAVDYTNLIDRLPVGADVIYRLQYMSSEEDRRQAFDMITSMTEKISYNRPHSLTVPPSSRHNIRPNEPHTICVAFNLEETQTLRKFLRNAHYGLESMVVAASLLAVRDVHFTGLETGGVVDIARSAKQWMDASQSPCVADMVSLWVPLEQKLLGSGDASASQMTQQQRMIDVYEQVRKEWAKFKVSPHYIAAIPDLMKPAMQWAASILPGTHVAMTGHPTPRVAHRGIEELKTEYVATSVSLRPTDFQLRVRSHDPHLSVQSSIVLGKLQVNLGFNSKYHDPDTMVELLGKIKSHLESLIGSD